MSASRTARVQMSVSAGIGWPSKAMQYYFLMSEMHADFTIWIRSITTEQIAAELREIHG